MPQARKANVMLWWELCLLFELCWLWFPAAWFTHCRTKCDVYLCIHSLGVRTDVSYHDMEEIDNMQSIPELERFLALFMTRFTSVSFYTHPHTTEFTLLPFLSCPVTVLCAVCFKLTFLNQKEEFCWSYTSRLCFFVESATSNRNKPLLYCPSWSPSMRLTLVGKSDNYYCDVPDTIFFNFVWDVSPAETPLNNIEQCFKYCKELLLCHSVRVCTLRLKISFNTDIFP